MLAGPSTHVGSSHGCPFLLAAIAGILWLDARAAGHSLGPSARQREPRVFTGVENGERYQFQRSVVENDVGFVEVALGPFECLTLENGGTNETKEGERADHLARVTFQPGASQTGVIANGVFSLEVPWGEVPVVDEAAGPPPGRSADSAWATDPGAAARSSTPAGRCNRGVANCSNAGRSGSCIGSGRSLRGTAFTRRCSPWTAANRWPPSRNDSRPDRAIRSCGIFRAAICPRNFTCSTRARDIRRGRCITISTNG